MQARRKAAFDGRVVIAGFGSVAQGLVPGLFQALGLEPRQVHVLTPRGDRHGVGAQLGITVQASRLTPDNYEAVLRPLLREGDFLLNLAVDVSSLALIRLCRELGVLYLDADNQPWPGEDDASRPPAERTNYRLREDVLAFRRQNPGGPTACITQGANPGLVNSLLKVALLEMAKATGLPTEVPQDGPGWGALARALGIKVIHCAERDSQLTPQRRRRGEFVNTWSVEAFVGEGLQPSELGWGTHERHWPEDARRHGYGSDAAIFLDRPGMGTRVRSWTPLQGPYHGFLVTHAESLSIADYLTVREGGEVAYRPTVHYAYHPCEDAVASIHELAGRHWRLQEGKRILCDEIGEGRDELGMLLMGNPRGVYWYGSRLSVDEARALLPFNNATSLQVVAGIVGAMQWALRNPRRGVVEPDEIDHRVVMETARPWLGEVAGTWADWTPLKDRSPLFPEPQDPEDPWQFLNFRVT